MKEFISHNFNLFFWTDTKVKKALSFLIRLFNEELKMKNEE